MRPRLSPLGVAWRERRMAPAAQMRHQLLLQDPARLDEQALVDCLVRHLMRLVRVGALQPPGDLLGRPLRLDPVCNNPT